MQIERLLRFVPLSLLISCFIFILWPSDDPNVRYTSVTTYHVTQDQMIPAERAAAEANQILQEARQLSEAHGLTPDQVFAFQKRMKRLDAYAEHFGPNPRQGAFFGGQIYMHRLAGIRDDDRKGYRNISKEEHRRYQKLFETDPEWLALEKFRASTTTDNKSAAIWYRIKRYVITIPFGMIACVLMLIFLEGMSLGHAVVKAFNRPFLMVLYPLGFLWVVTAPFRDEWGEHREELKRLASAVSYATAASISVFCGGGTAAAQTVKKDDKKKNTSYTLQLDDRVVMVPAGDSPPTLFNRTTLNARGWLVEAISTTTPKSGAWYNETGVGVKLVQTPKTTLSAIGIVSNDSAGVQKVMLGAQYFHSAPTSLIAIPVARVEKAIAGPVAVAVAANPFWRLGHRGKRYRWALSPDIFVRKTLKKPLSWTAGLGAGLFTRKGKGDRAEVALLINSSNQWQVRGRYILNFAF